MGSPSTAYGTRNSPDPSDEDDMDYVFGPHCDWGLVADLLSGCSCGETCSTACPCAQHGAPYTDGRLSRPFLENSASPPIFECNSACLCSTACRHRLVTRCRANPPHLVVRRLPGSEDRGLFTQRALAAGECVCVFLGEVIDAKEAARREADQMRRFGHTYVLGFCERLASGPAQWTFVDGRADVGLSAERCPVAAFANHSCDPNCLVLPVRADRMVPYLVLFARRPLAAGDEVTFDYGAGDAARGPSERRCMCGATICKGFLPRNSQAFL